MDLSTMRRGAMGLLALVLAGCSSLDYDEPVRHAPTRSTFEIRQPSAKAIEGCYFNVVGLPMVCLSRMLHNLGFPLYLQLGVKAHE